MQGLVLAVSMLALADDLPPPATVQACSAAAVPVPEQLAKRSRSVVRIETVASTGSGVVVAQGGWVLTAAHVVGTASTVRVVYVDGSSVDAEVVRSNAAADLALVRAPGNPPCAPLSERPVAAGVDVYAVGSPHGAALTHSVSRGIASAWRDLDGWQTLQTDASINRGNSGGPVFDAAGEVQAVVSFKVQGDGVEGLGFGIGVSNVARALGVTMAAQASGEVSVWKGGAPAMGRAGAVITGGPAERTPLVTKDPCKRAGAKEEADAFSDAGPRMRVERDDVRLVWAGSRAPVLSLKSFYFGVVPQVSAGVPAGWLKVDLALEDGTRIHLSNDGGAFTVSPFGTDVWATYPTTPELLVALAASPVMAVRWTRSGQAAVDKEPSGGMTKQLPAAAACALGVAP